MERLLEGKEWQKAQARRKQIAEYKRRRAVRRHMQAGHRRRGYN